MYKTSLYIHLEDTALDMILLQIAIDAQDEAKAFVKEVLKQIHKKDSDAVWLIGVIIVNVLVSIAGLVSQFIIKSKDKDIYKFTVRENKRISILENIYSKMCSMAFDDSRVQAERDALLIKLQEVNRICMEDGLYLDEKNLNIISAWTDYYKEIIVDYRKKSYSTEEDYRKKFISYFNK